jgi:rod shape-determining protein MreC
MQTSLMFLARPVTGAAEDYSGGRKRTDTIAKLTAENVRLTEQLRLLQADAAEPRVRRGLAASAAHSGSRIVLGRVVAVDPTARSISVDVGRKDGIEANTAVLDADGLIGRVSRVTARTATVLLLVDPLSTVGVRSTTSGHIGTLQGTGGDLARLTFFDRNAKVDIGEALVTFGSRDSRPYPAGIPVGWVVSVKKLPDGIEAMVAPHSRFGTLDAVGIVTGPAEPDTQSLAKPAAPARTRP